MGSKLVLLCLTAAMTASSSVPSPGEDEGGSQKATPGTYGFRASAGESLAQLGTLLESADDLRAAGASLEKFGNSVEKATSSAGIASEAVSENLADMSQGFDPLGLQNGFRAIQQQTELIRQQQAVIFRLQQNEIQRLRRENKELRAALKKEKSKPREKNKPQNM